MTSPLWADLLRDLEAAEVAARLAAAGDAALDADPAPFRVDREVAVGKRLHDAYSAAEAALCRLIENVDGSLPSGPSWHRDLLRRAAHPLDGVRGPILRPGTADDLSRLSRFRHAFRNVYERFEYGMARENVAVAADAIPRAAAEIEDVCRTLGILDQAAPRRFPHPA